jgi:hypothetical protein
MRFLPSIPAGSLALTILVLGASYPSTAQQRDSTLSLRTVLSVTQNGFSLIPSFSLGKPAVFFEPVVATRRMSFEPLFRFSLEGKPWSLIFIYRYKIVDRSRFQLQLGGHIPALIFFTQSVVRNGVTEDVIVSQRYLAGELLPNYDVSRNFSVGAHVLRGHGFDSWGTRNTFFVGARATLTNVNLSKRVFLKFTPMVYYLKADDDVGYYLTNTLVLAIRRFPLSVSNIINKAIDTEVPGKDFDWTVSLVYTFDRTYVTR